MIFTSSFSRVKAQFYLLLPGWKGTAAILNGLIDIRSHVFSSLLWNEHVAKQLNRKPQN